MAKACIEVIEALRCAAANIEKSDSYQLGHMGLCNCGFLAQQITCLRKDQIHTMAMQRSGDWSEQLNDYCPTSGLPMDELIAQIIARGFDADDLKHLERLSDPTVLAKLPGRHRFVRHNVKADVVLYLRAWAEMLQDQMLERVRLPHLSLEHSLSCDHK